MDELADELNTAQYGFAAARVSAAGLGGRVCIHAPSEFLPKLLQLMTKKGWSPYTPHLGSPTQIVMRQAAAGCR
jgi:hypothetical protein